MLANQGALVVTVVSLSADGDLLRLVGDFTPNAGDADGTITVGGARVYLAHFYDQNDTTPTSLPFPVKISLSGALVTITINVSGGATAGRFYICYR